MPLNKNTLSIALKPIFKNWSEKAFLDIHNLQFSLDTSIEKSQILVSEKFGNTFSSITPELYIELNKTLLTGIVKTSKGVSPTIPLPTSFRSQLKPFIKDGVKNTLLKTTTLNFSEDLDIGKSIELISEKFGNEFSKISTGLAKTLNDNLTAVGYQGLNTTNISNSFKPILKKWSKKAFKTSNNLVFDLDTSIENSQKLLAKNFGNIFSGIAPEFSDLYVSILKNNLVRVPSGVGKMS